MLLGDVPLSEQIAGRLDVTHACHSFLSVKPPSQRTPDEMSNDLKGLCTNLIYVRGTISLRSSKNL